MQSTLKRLPNRYKLVRRPIPKRASFSFFFLFSFSILLFCAWFVFDSLHPTLPHPSEPPKLYSNQSRQDLTLTFLNAIERATKSIYLVMFGLNDPSILSALSEKIDQEVPATLYYDPNGSPQITKLLPWADARPVHMPGLMHQKLLILDDETVFIGSANMTPTSLRMHDNLVIGLANQQIALFLKQKAPHQSGQLKTIVGGQPVELWLLPDPKGHLIKELKKHIRQATHSIRIALFTFTHPALLDELIAAQQRGVQVTVVIDLHSGLGASKHTVAALQSTKIRVLLSQGIQLMHHKFVYLDERTLITGSANWTKAAFTKNSDCLILLQDLTEEQKKFMNTLWKKILFNGKKP